MTDIEYKAADVLANLSEAVRYNAYLERELAQFMGNEEAVVDFGAGLGEFARRLSARGHTVTCVDADPSFRRQLSQAGFDTVSALEELRPESVNRVMTLNVLEHIADDMAVLDGFRRIMREEARLFIFVPAFQCIYSSLDRQVEHVRRYGKQELLGKLQETGFEVESIRFVDSIGFLAWGVAGWLNRLSDGNVRLYDRMVFPVSRLIDRVTERWVGKNLLAIARKPRQASTLPFAPPQRRRAA